MLKSIALSEVGQINESFQIFIKIVNEKNLPLQWMKETEYLKRDQGSNWFSPNMDFYFNNLPWYHEKNKEAIENIQKMNLS